MDTDAKSSFDGDSVILKGSVFLCNIIAIAIGNGNPIRCSNADANKHDWGKFCCSYGDGDCVDPAPPLRCSSGHAHWRWRRWRLGRRGRRRRAARRDVWLDRPCRTHRGLRGRRRARGFHIRLRIRGRCVRCHGQRDSGRDSRWGRGWMLKRLDHWRRLLHWWRGWPAEWHCDMLRRWRRNAGGWWGRIAGLLRRISRLRAGAYFGCFCGW